MAQWIGNKLLHDATGCCIEVNKPNQSKTLDMPEGANAQTITCTNHDCLVVVFRDGRVFGNQPLTIACPACGVNGVVMMARKKRKPKKPLETQLVYPEDE